MISNKVKFSYILIIFIYIFNIIFNIYKYEYKYKTDSKYKKYQVIIVEKQKEEDNKITYIAKLNNDKVILNIYTKNKYDSKKDFSENKIEEVKSYKYGDRLKINGKIIIPELLGNIGEFDYKKYLNSKEIVCAVNAYSVNYVDNVGNSFIKKIFALRRYIELKIDKNLESKEANLLKGMLYGDTKELDYDIKHNFQNIGISHITAVSGANLTIFLVVFTFVLNKTKINNYIYVFIQLFLISIFCLICGFELSVLRAGIMMFILSICKLKNIKISIEKALILTLFIMLFFNPYRIFNIGMILSFLATTSIAMFYPKIYNFLESKIYWNIKNKLLRKLLLKSSLIFSVTLSANILILPVVINTFNKFSFIFIISNLFISTLSSFINLLGIIVTVFPLIPILNTYIFFILNILLKLLIKISYILNKVNLNLSLRNIPFYIIFVYYLYFILTYLKYNSKTLNSQNRLNIIKLRKSIFYLFIILICIWSIYMRLFDNYIYYFNVGQGEMCLVKKDNTVIMIDSGSITNDTSYIFDLFAKKTGIDKIDILVISHFHTDHINGIKDIIEKYKVEYIMYSYPYDFSNEEYLNFLSYISESDAKCIVVKSGDRINIGKVYINVIFPDIEYITVGNNMDENENANSLVLNIKVNNKNYLFLGDSVKESEENILQNLYKANELNAQNIKIAHHGSKTSTSELFIAALKPKYAIISAKKKAYNHPSDEVLNLLNKYRTKTYITEKVGGIKFWII